LLKSQRGGERGKKGKKKRGVGKKASQMIVPTCNLRRPALGGTNAMHIKGDRTQRNIKKIRKEKPKGHIDPCLKRMGYIYTL